MRIQKNICRMRTIQCPNKIRSHLVSVVPMAHATIPKSTSKCTSDIRKSFHAAFPALILHNPNKNCTQQMIACSHNIS